MATKTARDNPNRVPLRVLLVEDSEADATLILRLLWDGGYNPASERVETGSALAAALKRQKWDVVLCDYKLPNFSAWAALLLIKRDYPNLPIIVVSGHVGEEIAVRLAKAGAQEFVSKLRLRRLPSVVARVLRQAAANRELDLAKTTILQLVEIIEGSSDAIISQDLQGVITSWNRAAQEMYGYRSDEVLGQPIMLLVPPGQDLEIESILDRIRRNERVSLFETVRVAKGGRQVQVSLSISPITDGHGTIIGASSIARDITERLALELQFRHSQKMEAVGLLAGSLAHDFNNQLTILKGSAQFLLNSLPINDSSRRDVQRICATVDRGASLVHKLLAFSRRQEIEISAVDLTQLVRDEAAMFHLLLGEQVQLELRLEPKPWVVQADPAQLNQVLMNLMANARDAMAGASGAGKSVTVETYNVDVAEGGIRVFGETVDAGRYVMLAVSDTGCGMTPEVRERIFEPFFTTKGPDKGTGLGLSTAYGIVKQHRGQIVCQSAPGSGTTIRIYLPSAAEELDDRTRADGLSVFTRPPASRPGTVLVAEDEEGVREIVAEALRLAGYTVHVATGVEHAVKLANGGEMDLLVTDLMMQDGNGHELALRLTQSNPDMKVLFMSGYSPQLFGDSVLEGTSFLQKPFDLDSLIGKVQEMLKDG